MKVGEILKQDKLSFLAVSHTAHCSCLEYSACTSVREAILTAILKSYGHFLWGRGVVGGFNLILLLLGGIFLYYRFAYIDNTISMKITNLITKHPVRRCRGEGG